MPKIRSLPARPSLAFDRKEAKVLLRRLRSGDPEALIRARAQHPAIDVAVPSRIALADAQLVVAREYGFMSWPRLVQYYAGVERQSNNYPTLHRPDEYDGVLQSTLQGHRARHPQTGRMLAAYVPQCYGMRVEDVFDVAISEDDARLAIARNNGCTSWEMLIERATMARENRKVSDWEPSPLQRAGKAIQANNLQALQQVVDAHPELLHPTGDMAARGGTLFSSALHWERVHGRDVMRPIMEWLASQGQDLQLELNRRLCGAMHMKPDDVRHLLERGANPNWIAPNGLSVLEHALLRYWNGEAVDLIAQHAVPRRALWIAAGLGDVAGVASFLDRNGKPTPAARQHRAPLDAVGPANIPVLPDADDEEVLLEAFWVAVLNGRTSVLEYMASRGFNVNCVAWGTPILQIAVGNFWKPVVESLLRCGADLDLRGWGSNGSAREMARNMFENQRFADSYRDMVVLCGLDPDALIAEADAKRVATPAVSQRLQDALVLAEDDAFRQGQSHVTPENLLFGLLRYGELPLVYYTQTSRLDRERFHAAVRERVGPGRERASHESLPMTEDARAILVAATSAAFGNRRESVNGLHLLFALLREEHGATARMLVQFGGDVEKLTNDLMRAM